MRSVKPAQSKRQAIIAAATQAFLADGYEGTKLETIASSAGAARRTIYNLFESKEALFEATVEALWERMEVPAITGREAAARGARAGLMVLGQAVADFWTPAETVSLMRMVISEGQRFPDLAKRFFAAGKSPTLRAVADFLKQLEGKGLRHIDDRNLATRQFLGLINEPLLWARVIGVENAPTVRQRDAAVTAAVDMFLAQYGSD
ncbi:MULTISPECIES: TetR/AcrR family transcriptional regulator [Rhodanobacteraceae]|uniref:TetR/AcrR family transcriptional regulator n=1 Tax=Rhodanobacteraceae TaxID=1775411 RepID=UPI00088108B3|nr:MULTISPECIES: TetR/AcrR family transcriptional regulator [Rhodanobacteraceae]SDG02478.1 DNA-binding transcriptional regulator, AcrR family [Dyella sp. 333MFSha]SKB30641.1 transcriptional regulator, TetR family [Luteibacter sp. 22Crub2.1]